MKVLGVVHLYTTIVTMWQCGVARVKGKGVGKAKFLGRKGFAVNKAGTAGLSVHCKTCCPVTIV